MRQNRQQQQADPPQLFSNRTQHLPDSKKNKKSRKYNDQYLRFGHAHQVIHCKQNRRDYRKLILGAKLKEWVCPQSRKTRGEQSLAEVQDTVMAHAGVWPNKKQNAGNEQERRRPEQRLLAHRVDGARHKDTHKNTDPPKINWGPKPPKKIANVTGSAARSRHQLRGSTSALPLLNRGCSSGQLWDRRKLDGDCRSVNRPTNVNHAVGIANTQRRRVLR